MDKYFFLIRDKLELTKPFHILISAGEASGDLYGALFVQALQRKKANFLISGIGGPALAKTGIRLLARSEKLALIGISEVIGKFSDIWQTFFAIKRYLYLVKPNLLVLIDFPDFNIRLAAIAKKIGIKVFYYISPQVWAWRQWRAKKLEKLVDHLAVIFPFEIDFFKKVVPKLPTTFVGHPLLDKIDKPSLEKPLIIPQGIDVVGLLPGSRISEIIYLAPLFLDTAQVMNRERSNLHFILPIAPGLTYQNLDPYLVKIPNLTVLPGCVDQVMAKAKILIIASGTATLQAALAKTPMIVVYKMGKLNYILAKWLIKVKYIAMPNLIANHYLVPELIQEQATPYNISKQALTLLFDERAQLKIKFGLNKVIRKLGIPGASQRTANLALSLIEKQ